MGLMGLLISACVCNFKDVVLSGFRSRRRPVDPADAIHVVNFTNAARRRRTTNTATANTHCIATTH